MSVWTKFSLFIEFLLKHLNPFKSLVSFYSPWKHHKISGLLIFSGSIERDPAWNGLKKIKVARKGSLTTLIRLDTPFVFLVVLLSRGLLGKRYSENSILIQFVNWWYLNYLVLFMHLFKLPLNFQF